jgi:aspartate/methionine/tyrosine aminotransferase
VAFPQYLGQDGVESFCRRAVEEHGILLLPSSVYHSAVADVPTDRFRIGIGRTNVPEALRALEQFLAS